MRRRTVATMYNNINNVASAPRNCFFDWSCLLVGDKLEPNSLEVQLILLDTL